MSAAGFVSRLATPMFVKLGGGAIVALLVLVGIQSWRLSTKTEQLEDTRAAFTKFQDDVRLATEQARRRDAENVARVQREQSVITEEVSREYQADLAALRARVERLRQSPQLRSGNVGPAPVSTAGTPPGGPDAAPVDP